MNAGRRAPFLVAPFQRQEFCARSLGGEDDRPPRVRVHDHVRFDYVPERQQPVLPGMSVEPTVFVKLRRDYLLGPHENRTVLNSVDEDPGHL
jgi:hypothetical protein